MKRRFASFLLFLVLFISLLTNFVAIGLCDIPIGSGVTFETSSNGARFKTSVAMTFNKVMVNSTHILTTINQSFAGTYVLVNYTLWAYPYIPSNVLFLVSDWFQTISSSNSTTMSLTLSSPLGVDINFSIYQSIWSVALVTGAKSWTFASNVLNVIANSGTSTSIIIVFSNGYSLTILAATGGNTYPSTGVYTYGSGDIAIITAYPSYGYDFTSWLLDGGSGGSSNPIVIVMNSAHTLQAVFTAQVVPPPPTLTGNVTIIDSGATVMGQFAWRGQRHTYSDGKNYYAFWITNTWDIDTYFDVKYAYSPNGTGWTIAILVSHDAFGGQTWTNNPMSIYGNGTHIGVVISDRDDACPSFVLAKINSGGSLTVQESYTGVFGTSGLNYIGGYEPTITQDSDGYWHIVADYRGTSNAILYHVVSLDKNGTSWGSKESILSDSWNYGDPREEHCGIIINLGIDQVCVYGRNNWDNTPIYSRIRDSFLGTWSAPTTIISDQYNGAREISGIFDEVQDKIVLILIKDTQGYAYQYDLPDATRVWVQNSLYASSKNSRGAISTEPNSGDYYCVQRNSSATFAEIQDKIEEIGVWTSSYVPTGWHTTSQSYSWYILDNEYLNRGMFIGIARNGSSDNWHWILLTMLVPVGKCKELNITGLNANYYMEANHPYVMNLTIIQTSLDTAISNITITFADAKTYTTTIFYDNLTDTWTLSNEDILAISGNDTYYDGSDYFYIWVTLNIKDTIIDDNYVSINVTVVDILGVSYARPFTNKFGFYKNGGFTTLQTTADYSAMSVTLGGSGYGGAGRTTGGNVFSLWVDGTYDSLTTATSTVLYKRLQAFHIQSFLRAYWYVDNSSNYVSYGIDMWYGGAWQHGWALEIRPIESHPSGGEGFLDNDYVKFTITWLYNNAIVKTDTVIGFYDSDHKISGVNLFDINRFWIDLWFSKVNGSTIVGGRINPVDYGMSKQGTLIKTPWFTAGGSWQPITDYPDVSEFYHDLTVNGEIVPAESIEAMRVWCKLSVGKANLDRTPDGYLIYGHPTKMSSVTDNKALSFRVAIGRMEGVDTPSYIDTAIPKVTFGWTFGEALLSGFSWILKPIADAMTSLWAYIMPWLASSWNALWLWLCGLPYIGQVFTWFGNAFTTLVTIFGTIFTYFGLILSGITGFFNGIILVWNQETTIFTLITVTYGQLTSLAIGVAFIMMFIEGTEGNWDPLLNTLRIIWGIAAFLLNWSMRILEFVADRIIGGLPI